MQYIFDQLVRYFLSLNLPSNFGFDTSMVYILPGFLILMIFLLLLKKERKNRIREYHGDALPFNKTLRTSLEEMFQHRCKGLQEKRLRDLLEKLTPVVMPQKNNSGIARAYLSNSKIRLLEELFTLWRMGFRDDRLPILFLFYYDSIGSHGIEELVFSLKNYPGLSDSQSVLTQFYFQDVLGRPVFIEDATLEKLEKIYQTPNLELSLALYHYRGNWNLKNFRRLVSEFPIFKKLVYNTRIKGWLIELLENSTDLLTSYMFIHFSSLIGSLAEGIVCKVVFKHGNYEKLKMLENPSPEISSFTNALFRYHLDKKGIANIDKVISYLTKQTYGKLHIFSFLRGIQSLERLHNYSMTKDEISETIDQKEQMPIHIRWIFFQYLIYTQYYEEALLIYSRLGVFKNTVSARLFRIRCMFNMNERYKAYTDIKKLMEESPDDISIMNEYAIYCSQMEQHGEAERIFQKIEQKYPEHPIALYNQAVLFENYYSEAIRKKWNKVEELKLRI